VTENSEPVVEIKNLGRKFGDKIALDNVSLSIPRGSVFGMVGENGAGKTTLIKHIMGLLRAMQGTVRVFGLDPVVDPKGVLSRIGYLSEESDLPQWMRIDELMTYSRAFYPGWDDEYAEDLRKQFALEPKSVLKNLSKGQRARAGLLVALAYRPELLLLDEPSAGLDPIVRRDILSAIIRTIADEGRTVLFSSHLLGEVERVSDRVVMIRGGKVVFCDTLEAVKEGHRRVVFQFDAPRTAPPTLEGALDWSGEGREWTALCYAAPEQIKLSAQSIGAEILTMSQPSLDDIFVARAGARIAEHAEA
jgi:ABC-2 type transport system ATP-binding protein